MRAFLLVKISAKTNSFHEKTTTNTQDAIIPWIDSGMTTLVRRCSVVAPSMDAASSNSIGISSMKVFMIQVDRLTKKAE